MKQNKILYYYMICACFSIAANFVHPVTPTLIVERQLDSSIFGTALAAMQTTYFLFAPFWGKLCNYIPTKKIMLISALGYAIGQMIFGSAQNEMMVFAGRMFAGIFTGGCFTAFSNYIINISDISLRNSRLTTLLTLQTVAGSIGYFIGGFLGLISVEVTFYTQVLVLVFCGIMYNIICIDDTPYKVKPSTPLTLKEVNPFSTFINIRRYVTPMLMLVFGLVIITGIGYSSYEQSFNYYIKDQFSLNSSYNGMIKMIIAVITLVFNSTICLYLQRKTDINKTFLPVVFILTTIIGSALFIKAEIPFMIVYIIYSGFNAVRIPLLQSLAASRTNKDNSNTIMGFYQSMNSLGSIFGALFAGLIYNLNPLYPFILAFIAYIISCIVGIIYYRRYNREYINE